MTSPDETLSPMLEATAMVESVGGDTVRQCYQCGTCSASCPHNQVSDFRIRTLVRLVQLGLEGYEGDILWRCSTCNTCVERCPRGVEIVEVVAATRRVMSEMSMAPAALSAAMGSVSSVGNPWSGEPEARHSWAKAIPLPPYEASMDVLLYQCCTMAYDPRSRKVAEALLRLLTKAGLSFGVLPDERCCGESARKSGWAQLFETLRDDNSRKLLDSKAPRVVTTSPHCHHTLSNEYPELVDKIEIVHVTTLLRELIDAGKLVPKNPVRERVTYHDPCYLGRRSGIYDDPRKILEAIPGLELTEMKNHHETSLCCGGGGGGMWLERAPEERLSVVRWKQADAVGAPIIASACPYCMLMLEDGKVVLGRDDTHQVVDVIELLEQSL